MIRSSEDNSRNVSQNEITTSETSTPHKTWGTQVLINALALLEGTKNTLQVWTKAQGERSRSWDAFVYWGAMTTNPVASIVVTLNLSPLDVVIQARLMVAMQLWELRALPIEGLRHSKLTLRGLSLGLLPLELRITKF